MDDNKDYILKFINTEINHYNEILKYNKNDCRIQKYYKKRLYYFNEIKKIVLKKGEK